MLSKEVDSSEELYRAILNNPTMWKEAQNRPSSAIFKDSKGVSVDRDGERDEENITAELFTRLCEEREIKAIVKIKAEKCYNLEVEVKSDPTKDNKYHAIIRNNEENPLIKGNKPRKLVEETVIVKTYC